MESYRDHGVSVRRGPLEVLFVPLTRTLVIGRSRFSVGPCDPYLCLLAMRLRILVLAFLFAVAAVSAAFADDVTWKAIWIGLASTTAAAGLVDCSALWETHQREQVLLRVVGQRVARIHQRMLSIIRAVFGVTAEARKVSGQLRAWEPRPIDLTEDAGILPPRSKQL